MKRVLIAFLLLGTAGLGAACSDSGDGAGGGAGGAGGGAGGGVGGGGGTGDTMVDVTADITADTTWTADKTYLLHDLIYVTGGTLTIEPGTTILGGAHAALIVGREAHIEAQGTASEPIVFTSAAPAGDRSTGDWAGLVLLGQARVNNGVCIKASDSSEVADTTLCDAVTADYYYRNNVEGIVETEARAHYGGTDDTWDCGTLEYVRVEFGGYELSPDNELNGLTLGACGSETTVSYVQVHRANDDGIEAFGGTPSLDHIVITGQKDDGLDWDLGFRGTVQNLIVQLYAGLGEHAFECDSYSPAAVGSPQADPTIYNATIIGRPGSSGLFFREGTQGELGNFIVTGFSAPIDVLNLSADEWTNGDLQIHNALFYDDGDFEPETPDASDDCGTMASPAACGADEAPTLPQNVDDDGAFDEAAAVAEAALENVVGSDAADDPGLTISETAPDFAVTNPDALPAAATPPAGLDAAATYVGAIDPAGADWTMGWTSFPVS
jgi:hypothetical protein